MADAVLIANRGEIAVRIARTVHALGRASAGVFTQDDAGAPHVDAVDAAVLVGSYLDRAALVAAAERTGARAVHPGYGFLSENAAFARDVTDARLTWIGPPPAAIELMGDKARAKRLAREAGVPVVPGLEGDDLALEELRVFADEHGFPIVVKAVAGGGGKGMRVVRAPAELSPALDAARREAVAAFGDGRVLVERYLERPRHLEVQVLADRHGSVVHLGERECSLQRRHQKVVEEAPSPAVGPELRERMGAAAVSLARACGYEGAGTVEFIASADGGDFAFLEMNTRLQVEHPVTELVYGVDLVALQLAVADGEPLGLRQEDLVPAGHAVEARLYAEDPANGFLPSTGTVLRYREPAGVRVDSGIAEGSEVGTAYDPMLAKVVAHGPDRAAALDRLDRALGELEVLGVATNAAFSRALLRRDDVRAGALDTGLLERVLDEPAPDPPEDLLPAAAIAGYRADTGAVSTTPGPWRRRLEGHGEVRVTASEVHVGERRWSWAARPADGGALRITLDGVSRRYAVAHDGQAVWVGRDGHQLAARPERRERGRAAAPAGSLEAPMPGTVLLVHVANGDEVAEGDVLLVLESMKMELAITAPAAGTVTGLEVRPGDRVAIKQPLVAVTADAAIASSLRERRGEVSP
ncbi:MAG: acetyl-CoA/propionyl-CoA carboxylase, biotin carboxylase, biotin carboxyl carrier protein [Solirubrobacteraceae bacterium]|nr:acetyl-CoA/propionyl-CoA carboxylase, biotin carboxylase, biotin carboxyl carrier protein [Solirubrobacteraceae bacterium]